MVRSALRDPDRFLVDSVGTARANLNRCISDAAEFARREPEKALGTAVAAGYLLRMLPVAGIISLIVRVALALVRPALVIYSGAKLWQKIAPAMTATEERRGTTGPHSQN